MTTFAPADIGESPDRPPALNQRISTAIPALHELALYPQWVCRNQAKEPINPHTGGNAKSNNPATWAPHAEAVAAAASYGLPGVGFVPTRHDPFVAGDIDHCVTEGGTIHPMAQAIIDQANTYCEISPSGTGVRFIAHGSLPAALRRAPLGDGMQLELFPFGQYVTITGRHIAGTPETINDAQAALDSLYSRYAPAAAPAPRPAPRSAPTAAQRDERYPAAWMLAVIRNKQDAAARMVINAPDGQRHHQRLAAGNLLGGLLGWLTSIGHGHLLTAEAAEDLIFNARPPGRNQASERRTIAAAIEYGEQSPLDIPPPDEKPAPAPAAAWTPPADQRTSTVEQRYLEIPAIRGKVLMVKSAMGTGKTESLSRLIPAEASVLIITHRVALGEQQAQRFTTDFYKNHGHDLDGRRRLVISLDSLDKLPLSVKNAFEYVVIDESEQVLTHLAGKTIKPSRRRGVLCCLAFFLTQARRVFYMDADLGVLSNNFAQRYHAADEITLLVNDYRPGGRQFVAMPQKNDVLAQLETNLNKGQTAYVAINSRRQVHALALSLQKAWPALRVIAISSENSNTPEIQHFIKNINSEIERYDVVITSPSLGTGVSIDTVYFDAVYLIGEAKTNTAADLHQMAGRVRTIKSGRVYCWIAPQVGQEITDPAILRQHAIQNWVDTGAMVNIDRFTGAITDMDSNYLDLWADIHAARNASINTLAINFYAQAEAAGHTLVQGQAASDDERAVIRAGQAEARAELDADHYRLVITAPEISADQYAKLENQDSTTPEENAAMVQYDIRDFFEEPVINITPELVAAHEDGLRDKVIKFAQLFHKDLALAADRAADPNLIADQRPATAARQLRVELLGYVVTPGLSHVKTNDPSGVTLTADHPDFAAWLTVNRDRIKRLLRLSVDPSKPETFTKFVGEALKQIGLKQVKVKQDKATGRRIYALDQTVLSQMLTYAERYTARKLAEQDAQAAQDATAPAVPTVVDTPSSTPPSSSSFTLTSEWQPIPAGVCLEGADYEVQQQGRAWLVRRKPAGGGVLPMAPTATRMSIARRRS